MTADQQLMHRLNGYRCDHFHRWAAGRMAVDTKGFQTMSVAELVTLYDKGQCQFWEGRNIINETKPCHP